MRHHLRSKIRSSALKARLRASTSRDRGMKLAAAILVCLVALSIGPRQARATVSLGNSTDVELKLNPGGTFIPGRDPFNTSAGIPPGGNDISFDPFTTPNPPQTNFEGGVDKNGNHIRI